MDNSPFIFGKIASGKYFINRSDEIKRLTVAIESGINTMLISPRRWGKSSLVSKVAETFLNRPKYRFCFIDLFNTRTEEEFYHLFVKQLIKSTSGRWEEWIKNIKRFLSNVSPKISIGLDTVTDIELQFEFTHNKLAMLDAIDLPEKIARSKKINLVVCIDEFQNLENFNDPVGFQQKIRAQWQKHQNVTYILYGSKRHMMMQLFEKKSMPLYRFGDVIYLKKIAKEHFVKFITASFNKNGKKISPGLADYLVEAVKSHPYYVQQLSHITWNNCDKNMNEKILDESIDELINNNAILYEREYSGLSNSQIKFLMILRDGIKNNFTSNEVIQKYNLGSSSNVIRVIKALEEKEIIDRDNKNLEIADPVFELWLKKRL